MMRSDVQCIPSSSDTSLSENNITKCQSYACAAKDLNDPEHVLGSEQPLSRTWIQLMDFADALVLGAHCFFL
jgi:hypothetical protein